MFTTLMIGFTLLFAQADKPALPETPQGRHVAAYIKAFNSGDEKAFIAAHEQHLVMSMQKNLPASRQSEMFKRMQGDFGTLKVVQVLKATADQIQIIVPTKGGEEGTFTFDFEKDAPYKISGIGVDVKG